MMQILTAFLGGILASLSPCVYPIIPITISYTAIGQNKYRNVTSFLLGKVCTLMALGFVATRLGEAVGFTSEMPAVQIGIGLLVLTFALFSSMNKVPGLLTKMNSMFGATTGPFIMGVSTALLVSPCTSPMLYSVLVVVASSSLGYGMFVMFAYALGFSMLLGLLGYGLVSKLPKSGKWLKAMHYGSSAALFILGIYYLWGGLSVWLS